MYFTDVINTYISPKIIYNTELSIIVESTYFGRRSAAVLDSVIVRKYHKENGVMCGHTIPAVPLKYFKHAGWSTAGTKSDAMSEIRKYLSK